MARRTALLWLCLVGMGCSKPAPPPTAISDAGAALIPTLLSVGPRLISNQTSQPLTLNGEHFAQGMVLVLPNQRELQVTVLDEHHGYTRLPADAELPQDVQVTVKPGKGKA